MPDNRQVQVRRCLGHVDSAINASIRILMIPILLCGIYIVTDAVQVYMGASSATVAAYKPETIDEESLQAISSECVAWIKIDGTSIDYPVMRAENNTKYLNRDPYGDYSLSGSVFMDCRNSPTFTNPYTIIYGHHMAAGLMFGALDAYDSEEFFNSHLDGTLYAGNEILHLEIYAFIRCDASHDEVFSPHGGLSPERLAWFRQNATHLHGEPGTRMIALTTCKAPGTTDRTVLLANITEGVLK